MVLVFALRGETQEKMLAKMAVSSKICRVESTKITPRQKMRHETSPQDNGDGQSSNQNEQNTNTNNDDGNGSNNDDQMQTFTASKPSQIKQLRLNQKQSGQTGSGRRNSTSNSQQKTRDIILGQHQQIRLSS